jgi:putative inorganic carbon (HCO3(-)) transporter
MQPTMAATLDRALDESVLLRASRLLLAVTIGGLPLYVVRWHYGPLPTTLLELLIEATVITYVIARWRQGWRRPVRTRIDALVVLLLLAGAVSVVVAHDHRAALGLYKAYFIEPVAVFYLSADLLRNPADRRRVVIALAIGSSILAGLNIAAFARALLAHHVSVGNAPNAVYGNANWVALYLEPPFAFAAGLTLFSPAGRPRWLGAAWLAVVGTALLLTLSKGAYLGVAALALVAIATAGRKLLLAAVLAAIAVVAYRIPVVAERMVSTEYVYQGRIQIYQATLAMLRDRPIQGLGLSGYSYKFHAGVIEIYPHNLWLAFWVETGLLGVIVFTLLLALLLWIGWRAWPSIDASLRPFLWGALGTLVLWIVHGLVDSPYWKNDMSVEFWIAAAFIVAVAGATARRRQEVAETESRSPAAVLAPDA